MEILSAALLTFLKGFAMVMVVLTLAGYTVLAERKLAGRIQGRLGPNRTALPFVKAIPLIGPFLQRLGLFQPLADLGKFIFKEEVIPGHVKTRYYYLAPYLVLIPALITMTVLPFGIMEGKPLILANVDIGFLFILAISSLGVYGIILAGWASNSKYPFLGGVRASAQMISYELAMGLSLLPVFMWASAPGDTSGLSLFTIAQSQEKLWLVFWQPLSALIFLVALFAETNRLPFDMAESETDLVAGYNTEYGALKFAVFFVAEYMHIIIGSAVFVVLFCGGWNVPFLDYPNGSFGAILSTFVLLAKTLLLVFFFIWVRWTLPRFRYDQVMNLGWKRLLPLAVFNLIFNAFLIAVMDSV